MLNTLQILEQFDSLTRRISALEGIEVPTVGGGGGAIGGTIAATQVAYGTAADTIGGEAAFTYDAATNTLTVDNVVINGIGGPVLAYPNAADQFTALANAAGYLYNDGAGALSYVAAPAFPAHNLLSATHTDTAANAATRGSLIYGDATPAWNELTLGGISGSVLTRDANDVLWSAGALAFAGAFTLTIPATGTALLRTANVVAGRVLFGSDANTADAEDALFWDGANNRLGIGITTPDEELHVYQATGSTQIHVETGDTNVVAMRLTNSEGDWAVRCDDGALRFYNQGAALTRALLNSVGDMGIGETSPVAQLHVYQSSSTGAQPVLYLRQSDVSEEAIYFHGTSSSVTADQTLIKSGDFPTAGALLGWLKIVIQDSRAGGIGTVDAWLPFYAVPS